MSYADTKWVTNFRVEGKNNIAAAVLTELFCFEREEKKKKKEKERKKEKRNASKGIPLENKMFYI
jgi:hypothetical protein